MTTPRHGRGHGPRLPRLLRAGPMKDASGTNIVFSYGKRLENISLVCADVKKICTFQKRGGVLSVLLHNRLVPRTSSMQSQFTLKFLMVSNCLK